jgi:hypothetical protein
MSGKLLFHTKDVSQAGTDFDVEVCFGGDWEVLDNDGDDRERDAIDIYIISSYVPDDCAGLALRVRHDKQHANSNVMYNAWYLNWVVVKPDSPYGYTYFYHYNDWIKIPKGDRSWHYIENFEFKGRASNQAIKLALQDNMLGMEPAKVMLVAAGLPGFMADALLGCF